MERKEMLEFSFSDMEQKIKESPLDSNDFRREFTRILVNGENGELERLKDECVSRYDSKELEVIFGAYSYLLSQSQIDAKKNRGEKPFFSKEKALEGFISQAEYLYLFTHYLLHAGQRLNTQTIDKTKLKNDLHKFWEFISEISEIIGTDKIFRGFKKGLLSQVAVQYILGGEMAMPDQDARKSIDLWVENETAIQVAGAPIEEPEIFDADLTEADYIGFPATQIKRSGASEYYQSKLLDKFSLFKMNIDEYIREMKKKRKADVHIHGYLVVIPDNAYDPDTGVPAPKIVDFFRNEIKAFKQ